MWYSRAVPLGGHAAPSLHLKIEQWRLQCKTDRCPHRPAEIRVQTHNKASLKLRLRLLMVETCDAFGANIAGQEVPPLAECISIWTALGFS